MKKGQFTHSMVITVVIFKSHALVEHKHRFHIKSLQSNVFDHTGLYAIVAYLNIDSDCEAAGI